MKRFDQVLAGQRLSVWCHCGDSAVLGVQCTFDRTVVNAVDIITWDDAVLITDFKVMVRPADAIPASQDKMVA